MNPLYPGWRFHVTDPTGAIHVAEFQGDLTRIESELRQTWPDGEFRVTAVRKAEQMQAASDEQAA